MTEHWVNEYIYCPICAGTLDSYENNRPVADFQCQNCKQDYELKSKNSKSMGKIVPDGAYDKMIQRITSHANPNFFFLNYDKTSCEVVNFLTVPKHLFLPQMIIKRKKAIPNRPNYFMCNIDISSIPDAGKIYYIKNKKIENKQKVLENWRKIEFLNKPLNFETKGWMIDVIYCIEKLQKTRFYLDELYLFEKSLALKHPHNNNIKAKIRQQLQLLRDKGYLQFEKRGQYKLL
jgi:type II restriction enzyme